MTLLFLLQCDIFTVILCLWSLKYVVSIFGKAFWNVVVASDYHIASLTPIHIVILFPLFLEII